MIVGAQLNRLIDRVEGSCLHEPNSPPQIAFYRPSYVRSQMKRLALPLSTRTYRSIVESIFRTSVRVAYQPREPLPYFRGRENQIASWVILVKCREWWFRAEDWRSVARFESQFFRERAKAKGESRKT